MLDVTFSRRPKQCLSKGHKAFVRVCSALHLVKTRLKKQERHDVGGICNAHMVCWRVEMRRGISMVAFLQLIHIGVIEI